MKKKESKKVYQIIKKNYLIVLLLFLFIFLILLGNKPTEVEIFGFKFPLKANTYKLQSLPQQITPTKYIKNNFSIKPKDIQNQIKSLPILQQENARENYKGIKVNWQVFLSGTFHTFETNKEQYILMNEISDKFAGVFIQCKVNVDKYPELKIINENQQFNVKGTINSTTSTTIYLDNCEFYFVKN